jgi:hypothetical protein
MVLLAADEQHRFDDAVGPARDRHDRLGGDCRVDHRGRGDARLPARQRHQRGVAAGRTADDRDGTLGGRQLVAKHHHRSRKFVHCLLGRPRADRTVDHAARVRPSRRPASGFPSTAGPGHVSPRLRCVVRPARAHTTTSGADSGPVAGGNATWGTPAATPFVVMRSTRVELTADISDSPMSESGETSAGAVARHPQRPPPRLLGPLWTPRRYRSCWLRLSGRASPPDRGTAPVWSS